MATFFTDFSEYSTGAIGGDADWTVTGATGGDTANVATDAGATGGQTLVINNGSFGNLVVAQYTGLGALTGDCQIYARWKSDTIPASAGQQSGPMLSNSADYDDSYGVAVDSGGWRGYVWLDGAPWDFVGADQTATPAADTYFHTLIDKTGTTIGVKWWADGDSEPGSFVTNTLTDITSIYPALAMGTNFSDTPVTIDLMGVGTGGDAAPQSAGGTDADTTATRQVVSSTQRSTAGTVSKTYTPSQQSATLAQRATSQSATGSQTATAIQQTATLAQRVTTQVATGSASTVATQQTATLSQRTVTAQLTANSPTSTATQQTATLSQRVLGGLVSMSTQAVRQTTSLVQRATFQSTNSNISVSASRQTATLAQRATSQAEIANFSFVANRQAATLSQRATSVSADGNVSVTANRQTLTAVRRDTIKGADASIGTIVTRQTASLSQRATSPQLNTRVGRIIIGTFDDSGPQFGPFQ